MVGWWWWCFEYFFFGVIVLDRTLLPIPDRKVPGRPAGNEGAVKNCSNNNNS